MSWTKVLPLARTIGISIALESPLPARELAQLVDRAHADNLGVYYDVGNAIALGFDPADEIHTLDQRILSVHIKDAVRELGALHLGQGLLDLPASLDALRNIHYTGNLMLETPGDDLPAVRQDIATLQQHLTGGYPMKAHAVVFTKPNTVEFQQVHCPDPRRR